jgi:hypothetical protein
MGGKTSKSTQAISVPPEVLARYNAVNARADTVTNKPYQYYTGQFVAPLTATQQAGISNTNAAAGIAQPYFGAATGQLMGAQQAAMPYYQGATEQLGQGINAGQQLAGQSYNTLSGAQNIGNQLAGQSLETLGAAQNQAGGIQQTALNNFNAAYAGAQPYNQAAGGLYQQGLEQGRDFTGQSAYGTQQALAGAQPFQQAATQYMGSGAQAVNPYDLGADQINKYMSPYLSTVLQGTAGLLNQQNQQQQSGQMGNAIRSGAFGGDRSGIAAANLNQQQNLANSKIFSDLLNQGFGQALGTAQQQQQLGLGAQQANRAAQQQASQQALAIGQQGFGQGLSAAQQQAALGQQLFGMGSTTGQNAAALGQQVYGQGTGTAAQQAAMGQQIFGQGATAAAQQAALGQQQFGQGATTAAQQAALGQQQFGQGTAASQQAAALGQGLYGMGANTSSQLAGLGTGAQGAALSGAGAQLAAGQAEQATQQAENTAKYNEFLQAQSLPYQQLKLASDIALGTGTASGSTTTTAQPGGFFSDERLKENIKAVGKTFDGQTIHSYNYKGDPRTQIGLIAQEVQKHHPEAVGLAGGYKTVDYDKATEDASDRGHMASGGLASAGGSVMPYNAGQGFADGGFAGFDPATMQQMLAAQQAMYAPLSSNNMYAGGPNAGGGLVPQSTFTQGQLMVPAELARQATGAEKAKTIVDLGKSVNEFGEGIGVFGKDKKPKDKNPEDEKNDGSYKYIEDEILNRALGGGIPYSGQGLDIPESGLAAGSGSPMTASALQAQQSGIQKLGDTADTGMKLFKAGKKLSKLFADGGGIPYAGQGLDIPDEDDSSKTYQLPTAGDMPDKPKSGFSKAVKVAGTVAKLASMFSDKRMKQNIKPIGKLFDGQIVHSFNYKGDPRTQIGLIAQEVEDHKPHAVGLAGKYKTVDYDKATSAAADRGHFAMGGDPKMPVNSIFASLRRDIDPRYALSDIAPEQDLELQREERQGAMPTTDLAKMPKPAGLASAGVEGSPNILQGGKPDSMPKLAGLSPAAASLPKDLSGIAKLIFAAEGDGAVDTSSALGRYGIIKGTYVDYFKKAFPQQARELGDAGIKALRTTPEGRKLNLQFGPMIIADNAKTLSKAGFDTNAGNVYLAHFLGPAGAVRALKAGPNTPVELAVDKDSIDANPNVFAKKKIRTVGELLNWSNNTMAKRAKEMGRASGGLAGRDGYALAGGVNGLQNPEDIDALSEMEKLPVEEIVPAPEMRKTEGLAPPMAATPNEVPATVPVAEKPVGLGAAAPMTPPAKRANVFQRVLGYDKSQPAYDPKTNNKFLQRLGHGETDAVLSAIQGIAAMGTAPTRSLGVALASGLGAGAQAFQGQREFGRQLRETAAVEASVKAKQDQANADVATAYVNIKDLPNKIAGWRQIARKGGPDAALATQTANTLQRIFNNAEKTLGSSPAGGQELLIPSDTPVPTAGAAGAPAKTPAKPTSAGSLYEDLQFQGMAGLPTTAAEKQLAMAEQGLLWDGEKFVEDPDLIRAKLAVTGAPLRQSSNITTDVEVGRNLFETAVQENINYQKANSIIQSIGSLPANQVPTTGFINRLAQAAGAAFGYDQAQMDAKFGEQPKINSILNAAAAEGINIDPSLGAAGVNVLIRALNEKARIAFIRAQAAQQFLRVTGGYSGGMEEFIEKALEKNKRKQ